ncbi:uncharacterized mitochondrial protein AtMg00810-like [Arachis duranensis]|uniref:Uncharacterized mitochondrial protein AtMg00810-like n=1 Tax=Arachis duranensis TaxID=130453 RepID=A0A6P5MI27_ARADU|nr:uncharacterized mitochondrial protein AtMg00810-like [Arachis duranensis]
MEHSTPVSTPIEEKFKLLREDKGRTVNPTYYKSLIGSLRYLTATRPDIVFGVGLLSRFMEEPCTNHLQVAKRILRYIKVFHGRSKHIDIRVHKIRELVNEKEVMIEYCPTEEQVADIFTKPLKTELFYKLKKMLRMINSTSLI